MPTVLFVDGWRFFFYSNEGNEPMHIHARKAEKECKYWIDADRFDIREEYSYRMNQRDKKQVRKLIFGHFDQLVAAWNEFEERRQ